MKRRIAVGIGLLLLLSSFTAVGAATSPTESQERAAERLQQFQVIQGQGTLQGGKPDLALGQSLTRAELATIMVRALGVDWRLSTTIRPAPYPDVSPEAWYAPQLHLLKNVAAEKGLTLGTAEGNFEPGRPVTRIEAIVLALKLIGLRPTEAGEPWHQPWVGLASQLGVLTKVEANNIGLAPAAPITRGEAFLYLDRLLDLPILPKGALYETIDRVPPTLVLNAEPEPETTQATFILAGTATDNRRIASITANGEKLVPDANGWFVSQPIPLQVGLNELELHVEDGNGNAITKTWQVMRICCFAARLEHALYPQMPRTLQPGERVEIGLKIYDENGKLLPPAPYELVTDLGTVEDGWFIARTQAGKGHIEIWTMNTQESFPIEIVPGPPVGLVVSTVKAGTQTYLQTADKWGNPILGGSWRVLSIGATVTQEGLFRGDYPGRYFVAVTVPGTSEMRFAVDVTP